ncbi:MAG TPA: 50S ribosomal protein L32 [Dehalococcoidia bacterium]|nr:50S ribosomal protein L32 [Dehalococcoidia bacterium]
MGALPKRKISQPRRGKRRSHLAASVVQLVRCTRCRSPRPGHHACPVCGFYNGRDAVEIPMAAAPER